MAEQPGVIQALIAACRPRQWTKNLLVYASALFSFQLNPQIWWASTEALAAFCLISSAVYLLNDVIDREADRAHPSKCRRPIASGALPVPIALVAAALIAALSLLIAAAVAPGLAGVIASYAVIQIAYCLGLKRQPLLDLFCIASGFLLRAIAGVVAGGFGFSPWFLLTVGLLALFLAIEKRKAELRVAQDLGVITRKVLERYSLPLLLRLESLVATSAFMSYSLWAAGPALNGASTTWMLLTVPFALVGIFRYQLLSDPEEAERRRLLAPERTSEKPEEILLGDRGIQFTLLAWLLTVLMVGLSHRADLLPEGGDPAMKVFLPGGAGLVGLNLIALLQGTHPDWELLVVDKKREAVAIARKLFPAVTFLQEDLTQTVGQQWPAVILGCDACVMLQAEIGNTDPSQFERNNVRSTEVVLEQLHLAGIQRLVQVSSSVVNSVATDLYTQTKRSQEQLVQRQWPAAVVLRPTF